MSATLEQLQRLQWPSVVRDVGGAEWRNGASSGGKLWFHGVIAQSPEEILDRGPVEIVEVATDSDEELVCPHCGHRHSEPYEIFDREETVEYECDECGQKFVAVADYTVNYSARKS